MRVSIVIGTWIQPLILYGGLDAFWMRLLIPPSWQSCHALSVKKPSAIEIEFTLLLVVMCGLLLYGLIAWLRA